MSNSTVIIIDDDVELCTSLGYLLESINIPVEIHNSPQSFLEIYDPHKQGCLLIDIRMPGMSGLELQRRLASLHNTMPIIFMTGHGDINMAVSAMKQGAFDFVTKPFNDQVFLDLIQKALAKDHKRPSKEVATIYESRFATLTKRECEIMRHLIDGKMNKVIAHELGISSKTVELHRSHLMKKMQVKSVAELVKIHNILGEPLETSQ